MIEVKNISKSYYSRKVLKSVNFVVPSGKILGLKGKNGVGKSTLINIMGGLTRPDSGFTLFGGKQISTRKANLKLQIGCVFENPLYIEKLTGKEFLEFLTKMYNFSYRDAQVAVDDSLEFFGLMPDKSLLIEKYSGGMKAKLSIASAILHKPKYLLLDEPFSGIDEQFTLKIVSKLKDIAQNGASILFVSHDTKLLELLTDFTYELIDGKVCLSNQPA